MTAVLPLRAPFCPKVIQGRNNICQLLFAYMQAAFRSAEAEVAQQLFDIPDMSTLIRQVGGKGMLQAMYTCFFLHVEGEMRIYR
jgi:hypothetical protein